METFTTCELAALNDLVTRANTEQKGSKVAVGGIVTAVDLGTTRTGNPSLKVTIEDYSGHYLFTFFGKNVDAFRPKFDLHQAVYVTAEIKPRFRGKRDPQDKSPEEFEIRVNEVNLLGNVNESHLRALKVYINEESINPELRKGLIKAIRSSKGPTPLVIVIVSNKHKWNVEMNSKKYNVGVNAEFLAQLKALGLRIVPVK
jgi:DNA polymerase-3 subunit alpha